MLLPATSDQPERSEGKERTPNLHRIVRLLRCDLYQRGALDVEPAFPARTEVLARAFEVTLVAASCSL
jgi:hypothetical protein